MIMKFDSWEKLQVKYKIGALGISLVALIYVVYIFLLLPQWTRIDELSAQYNTELQQVKIIETFVVAHPNPEEYLLELDGKIFQANNLMPDHPEISSFLMQLEQLSRENGVQLGYLKLLKTTNKTGYQELDVEFSINGSFTQIMKFLNKTENGIRFIDISNIYMQLDKDGLTSKFTAKIYSYGVPAVTTDKNNKAQETKK